jgi:cyclopropane fatty-acyl-phospholipid synthase-like methyltransferase
MDLHMRTEIITDPSELEFAWFKQYERLARIFLNGLGNQNREIVEIGCGSGQLTIPLAKYAPRLQFVLVDRFSDTKTGSYFKSHKTLLLNLKKARLKRRTSIAVSDYLKWVRHQGDERYDAIISSEFLPEISSTETGGFIRECYRILRSGGVTTHSFLSPIPRNSRQKLVILADSNPVWTKTPPKEWFSPNPKLVIKELSRSGFHRTREIKIRSHMIVKGDAASKMLKSWEVKAKFYEAHKVFLNESGLEIPDWIIVSGIKP